MNSAERFQGVRGAGKEISKNLETSTPQNLETSKPDNLKLSHIPIMVDEVLRFLKPQSGGIYLDGTVGEGGHSEAILECSSPGGRILGIDRDPYALEIARERLARFQQRVTLIHGNYRQGMSLLKKEGVDEVEGILLDLGPSTHQLTDPSRGFSFQTEGPLDMRMDPDQTLDAQQLLNTLSQEELKTLIYDYGGEKKAARIARLIVSRRRQRPLQSTRELADIALLVYQGRKRSRIHPATRTFQALRIAVNDELGALKEFLKVHLGLLRRGARVVIISFHSLEDRLVKSFFSQPQPPLRLLVLTPKPITPGIMEIQSNPRSRSAKLRAAQRI